MIDRELFGQAAQQRVEYLTLGLGVAAGIVALVVRGWPEAAGLVLGAGVAWINFRWLRRFVRRVAGAAIAEAEAQAGGQAGAQDEAQAKEGKSHMPKGMLWPMIGRYALLGLVLYAMLLRFYGPALAFLCGLFALVAAVLLELIGELVFWGRRSMLT